MKRHFILPAFILSAFLFLNFMAERKPVLFLIGDSTMADKPVDDNPERGWGQLLPVFVADEFIDQIGIENHARNGRSTKSFIDQGLWQAVYNKLRPGDYVFIQFGHNDSKIEDTLRYAEANTAYRKNLERFVRESRSKGAIPILLTPVNRRKFDKTGKFVDQHGLYPAVVREAAAEMQVPLIDLHAKSLKLFSEMGPEKTEHLFVRAAPGVYKAFPQGKEDNTHFNRAGAIKITEMVVEGIKELNLPIASMFRPYDEISSNGTGKLVGLDYYYNREFKNDEAGKSVQFHYIWEDRENSGYYVLGNLFENAGAGISKITEAPSAEALKNVSVYIIVDPDTPRETEVPNYISETSASVIAEWVKQGGTLMLFANDSINCEFKHLNTLAEKFGIHFNEDYRNPVKGKDYDMGRFTEFPHHPLFEGVRKIYLKEISTFTLTVPAKPVLTEGGDVIMCSSEYGKGFVFAVGDPWIYNEYIDNRRLPVGFENYKAAKNLVKWILSKASTVKPALSLK